MSDHDEIRTLLADYCRHCDDGRFDLFAQLFTEDAQFTALDVTHTGRAEIEAWMESVLPPPVRGKHMISEPAITLDGGSGASVRTDYAFIGRAKDGSLVVTSAGRYLDRLARGDDGVWRIASRRIVFMGDPE
jgi:uncharacterized protein (TIGR02246 family)